METPISTLITTILVGVLVLVGGTTILGNYASYNNNLDTTGLSNLTSVGSNSLVGITNSSNSMARAMQQSQNNAGIFGFLDTLINIGYNMLSSLFTSFSFAFTAITSLGNQIGIPTVVLALAGIFLTVFIALAIASAIFRIRL